MRSALVSLVLAVAVVARAYEPSDGGTKTTAIIYKESVADGGRVERLFDVMNASGSVAYIDADGRCFLRESDGGYTQERSRFCEALRAPLTEIGAYYKKVFRRQDGPSR